MNSGDDLQPRPDHSEPSRRLDPSLDRQQERQHREYVERTLREGRDPKDIRGPQNYVDTRDSYQKSREQGLNFAAGMNQLEERTREKGWTPEKPMNTPLGRRVHDNANEKELHKIEYKSGIVDEKAVLQLAKDRAALEAGYTVEWILAPDTRWDPLAKTRLRALEEKYPGQFTSREVSREQYEQALRLGGEIRAREAREKESREREARESAVRAVTDKARDAHKQQTRDHTQQVPEPSHEPPASGNGKEAPAKGRSQTELAAEIVMKEFRQKIARRDLGERIRDAVERTDTHELTVDQARAVEQAILEQVRESGLAITPTMAEDLAVLREQTRILQEKAEAIVERAAERVEAIERLKESDRVAREAAPANREPRALADVAALMHVSFPTPMGLELTAAQRRENERLLEEMRTNGARGREGPSRGRGPR